MHPIFRRREALLCQAIRQDNPADQRRPGRAFVPGESGRRRAGAAGAAVRHDASDARRAAGDRAGERDLSDPGRSRRAAQHLFSTWSRPAGWPAGDHRHPRGRLASPEQGGVWRPDRQCVRASWICRGRAELCAVDAGTSDLAGEPGRRPFGCGMGAIKCQRAGHRPRPGGRHGRIGGRQPGRVARDGSRPDRYGICVNAG